MKDNYRFLWEDIKFVYGDRARAWAAGEQIRPSTRSRRRSVDLRQLRYFITVARSGSFMAASRILSISQPALGYQVKRLEDVLEISLFDRHSRGVKLTEAGTIFLHHAESIFDRVKQAEEAIRPLQKKLAGEISFGVTPTSGRTLAPEIFAICAARTGLRITVHQGMSHDLFGRVEAGTLDMAFCYEAENAKKSKAIKLYREHLFLIGPPDIVSTNKSIAFDELGHFSLVLDNRFQVMRKQMERVARQRRIKLNVELEVEPINLKREMVIRHRRCTVVPYGLFLEEIRAKQLNARQIRSPALAQSLYLVFRRDLNAAVSTFMVAIVKDIVARKLEEGSLRWKRA